MNNNNKKIATMKLKHYFISVCVMLASALCINAQTVKNITLTEAGTLSGKLTTAEQSTLTELTISGPLNGADILTIRTTAGTLKVLNMLNATIIADNTTSYRGTGDQANYTQNNVIGDYMFYGMTALAKVVLPKDVWSIGSWTGYTGDGNEAQIGGSPKNDTASNENDTQYPGCSAFARCVNLKEVTLPTTLLWLGNKAFSYCIKLTSIAIPEGVEAIGSFAFNKCQELTTVKIPASLGVAKKLTWYNMREDRFSTESSYFGYTFNGCVKLSSITLASGVKYLAPYMFNGCSNITAITLPSSLLRLNSAFMNCSGITSLQLPAGLTETGTFSGCSKLQSLVIPNGVTSLPEGVYWADNRYDCAFGNCTSLKSITLPNQLTRIPAWCFVNCTALTSIVIPNTVSDISNNAFGGCTSLTSVTLSTETGVIGVRAFSDCTSLSTINFPSKLVLLGEYSFTNTALKNVQLPQSLTEIKGYAFQNCKNLETINFPANITDIYSYTFQNCTKLKNITLPSGLMTIQDNAFENCSSLGKVIIPGGVQKVNTGAFRNSGLTEVVLNDGVIALDNSSFSGCNLLKTVTFPPSMKTIGGFSDTGVKNLLFAAGATPESISDGAFSNCDSLLTVTLPNSIKKIGARAFYDCDTLQSITLPTGIDSIRVATFAYCKNLKTIKIPEGVKGIQANAFYYCTLLASATLPSTLSYLGENSFRRAGLTAITLPEGIKDLYYGTFAECSNLKSIKLPKSLNAIHDGPTNGFHVENDYCQSGSSGAFSFCKNLETVDFSAAPLTQIANCAFYESNHLRSIDLSAAKFEEVKEYAFYSCDSLRTVKFPATLTTISRYAFNSCAALESLTFPAALKTIGQEAFSSCKKIRSIDLLATSLTAIDSWFAHTDSLRTVKLPATVTAINDNAFNSCPIREINLPDGLTSIGTDALNTCQLDNLKIPAKVATIGESAFYGAVFNQVTIPNNVTSIGNNAFYGAEVKASLDITPSESLKLGDNAFYCAGSRYIPNPNGGGHNLYFHLSNVNWNSITQFPKNKFGQIDNLYLPTGGTVSNNESIGYIFYNNITDSIAIAASDNKYSVTKAIKTRKVTYTKNFNVQSGYGEAAGWKTLVLPFNVKTITHERGSGKDAQTLTLAPFGNKALETAGTLPFWLYELGADGKYKTATEIKAHQAYLICMPNNDKYPTDNNINGDVKFAAADATNGITLSATKGVLKRSIGTKFDLVPTYEIVAKHDSVYVLNEGNSYSADEKYYSAGSLFIKNYQEGYYNSYAVSPFQAYLVSKEGKTATTRAPRFYSIGGNGGDNSLEDTIVTPEKATKAYSRDGVLYIQTDADRQIHIYNPAGQTVRVVNAHAGENEVLGLDSGIYFLEGQKVAVGK